MTTMERLRPEASGVIGNYGSTRFASRIQFTTGDTEGALRKTGNLAITVR